MKHVDLKPGLGKALVAAKATPARATQPHGVKVMTDGEDTRWTRPDGTGVSVREVDTRVEETRKSLADSLVRLEAGEAAVQELQDVTLPALQETLDDLGDRIVAGGTTTVWSTAAPSASTPGVAEGQVWLQTVSDTDATVIGQWTWDGSAWKPVLIRSEVIANLDVSKLTAAEAVIAKAVIDKLFAQTFAAHKIAAGQIDAESVAAAVGTFVKIDVSQLTAATADLNEVVAQKIAGGIARFVELSADQITGGHFTGETFEGGTFIGTSFSGTTIVGGTYKTHTDASTRGGIVIDGTAGLRAWDTSGNQVFSITPGTGDVEMMGDVRTRSVGGYSLTMSADAHDYRGRDGGHYPRPGIIFRGLNNTGYSVIGAEDTRQDGGVDKMFMASHTAEGRFRSGVSVQYGSASMQAADEASTSILSLIPGGAGLSTRVASTGEVRQVSLGDTGWINVTTGSGVRVGEQLAYRIVNSVCYWRGAVYGSSSSDTLAAGETTIMTIPAAARPKAVQIRPAATNAAVHLFFQIDPNGKFAIWSSASTRGWVHISSMSYALG